jgi:uncharacterized protein YndB with AHSA1/START domain
VNDEMTFRELDIVRVFDAPPELVWRAWTDPDQLAAWWGPAGMHTPRETVELDLRPGGVLRLTMVMDDGSAEFPTDMRFTTVDPPAALGYEWGDQRGLGSGSVELTFKDLGDGRTEMTNHFAGYTTEVIQGFMLEGANQQFDKLSAYLKQ